MPEITGKLTKVWNNDRFYTLVIEGKDKPDISVWDKKLWGNCEDFEMKTVKCEYTIKKKDDKEYHNLKSISLATEPGKLEQKLKEDLPPVEAYQKPNGNGKKPFVKNDYVESQKIRIDWERENQISFLTQSAHKSAVTYYQGKDAEIDTANIIIFANEIFDNMLKHILQGEIVKLKTDTSPETKQPETESEQKNEPINEWTALDYQIRLNDLTIQKYDKKEISSADKIKAIRTFDKWVKEGKLKELKAKYDKLIEQEELPF